MTHQGPLGDTCSGTVDVAGVLKSDIRQRLFPSRLELVPQLNEVYELELASYESQMLTDEEIVTNGAYFARVGDQLTRHFLMCSGEPVRLPRHSSSRLRSFFSTNQFKTGYGTHGLFPYRGKFHPQMIKALINAMGLKPGATILDPMMGSGTVSIEACLMGVRSVGIDISPFCRFMTQAKVDALTMPLGAVRTAVSQPGVVFDHFAGLAGHPRMDVADQTAGNGTGDLFRRAGVAGESGVTADGAGGLPPGCDEPAVYQFLLLAYLDAAGYAQRSSRKHPREQFRAILERYAFVVEKIQRVLEGVEGELGEAVVLDGDARQLPLDDASVEGVIFSPPYSFAIDYLENDLVHLDYLGVDTQALRESMIGLRGQTRRRKFELYQRDMDRVMAECARVLRSGRICTVVVGTNNNQLSKITGVPASQVQGIDELLVDMAREHGLDLIRKLERQITGMANTMRSEFIVMLQRSQTS